MTAVNNVNLNMLAKMKGKMKDEGVGLRNRPTGMFLRLESGD